VIDLILKNVILLISFNLNKPSFDMPLLFCNSYRSIKPYDLFYCIPPSFNSRSACWGSLS
jgi:hypothetical protein